MAKNTPIEWTDHTWPVVNGCARISPGCGGKAGEGGCYAERLAATRLKHHPKYKGLATYGPNGPRWTRESRLWEPDLEMPLRLRKPSRIFVANLGDLFFEKVTNEEIAAVFGVMAVAPQHTFQVLTKRPARMREWFKWVREEKRGHWHGEVGFLWNCLMDLLGLGDDPSEESDTWEGAWRSAYTHYHGKEPATKLGDVGACWPWPLPNVCLGVSVEDQQRADERIPLLLQCPAAVRFLSVEPLLGAVDLCALACPRDGARHFSALDGRAWSHEERGPRIDWVIAGGESGPGARPCDVAWIRSIVQQCNAAGVGCFVKQLGAHPYERVDAFGSDAGGYDPNDLLRDFDRRPPQLDAREWCKVQTTDETFYLRDWKLCDRKGGDMEEWPADLRVRQFPEARHG